MTQFKEPLFPQEGNGCTDCGAHNIMHYSWCRIKGCKDCGSSNNMHNSWCKIHLGKEGNRI